MKRSLLVSFCNVKAVDGAKLALLDLDLKESKVIPITRESSGITGMTTHNTLIFLALQIPRSILRTRTSRILVLELDSLRIRNEWQLKHGKDIHSLYASNDVLYAVSTGTDEVLALKYRRDTLICEEVIWQGGTSPGSSDTIHVNSIVQLDEDLLVSGFGPKEQHDDSWSSAQNGFITRISSSKVLQTGLYHPHSLVVRDKTIYYCESSHGIVGILKPSIRRPVREFTRGLAYLDGSIYVGTSQARTESRSRGVALKESSGACSVVRLSEDLMEIRSEIRLGHLATEIYDILPLNRSPKVSI